MPALMQAENGLTGEATAQEPFGANASNRSPPKLGDFCSGQFYSSGTPGNCFAVRMVSEVFTLATFGAGVSLLVRNS